MKSIAFTIVLAFTVIIMNYGQQPDWKGVEKIFGQKLLETDGYYKLTFPRTDLNVMIDNQKVDPGLAFTSWAAFLPIKDKAMVMGDMVLLESELGPVLKSIEKNNFSVTAIHNHLIKESPKVMYLHYSAEGDPADLAQKLKDILSKTDTPLSNEVSSQNLNLPDWSSVQSILGKGNAGELLKYSFNRNETIKHDNMSLPKTYGINTAFGFQKVGDKAFTTGDFVLIANEVNKVIKILTQNNITVTALHNHMLNEEPRLFYMHFWGYDKPEYLAAALKDALEETNSTVK
ncbi:MAG: DUF1259 domain-containing protein [Ignavibacteriaceae bacterium]